MNQSEPSVSIVELNPQIPPSQILEALNDVLDPELGVDIVNLGLVYSVEVVGPNVNVSMTLTTPGCPMHGTIEKEVLMTLERLPGIEFVDVQIVWDPPWSPEQMTAKAKRLLYWL